MAIDSMAVLGRQIGEKLMKALHIEHNKVLSITISFLPSEVVTADVRIALDQNECEEIIEELKRYKLVEIVDGDSAATV